LKQKFKAIKKVENPAWILTEKTYREMRKAQTEDYEFWHRQEDRKDHDE